MNKISYLVTFEIVGVGFGCRQYAVHSIHRTQAAADKSLARLLKKSKPGNTPYQRHLIIPGSWSVITDWKVQTVEQGGVNQLFRYDY